MNKTTKYRGMIILTTGAIILTLSGFSSLSNSIEQNQEKMILDNTNTYTTVNEQIKPESLYIKNEEINTQEETTSTQDIDKYNVPLSYELRQYLYNTCQEYDIEYEIVLSVIQKESVFKHNTKCPNNIGGGYSYGLMQLNTNHSQWIGEIAEVDNFNIKNPYHNIRGGVALLDYYRNVALENNVKEENIIYHMLNSYNMGKHGYKKFRKKYGRLSRGYDKDILKNYESLKEQGNFVD